jgi:peptidyl-prolyl cis-trans isomerase D
MMFRNEIPHPYVVRSGFFNDSTGQYNPAMVDLVFNQADQISFDDPQVPDNYKQWKQGLIDLRTLISLDRQGSKWQTMISKAMLVSDNEINTAYNDEQRSANISYVFVPYSNINDSTVAVSEDDFSDFYAKHKARFKREKEVKIKYTYFQVNPSGSDSAMVVENLEKIKADFLNDATPFQYAFTNTDAASMDTSAQPLGQLPAGLLPYVNRLDTVVGPMLTPEGYAIYRVVRVTEDSASVLNKVRHILLNVDPVTNDSNALVTKARDLVKKIQGDSSTFAATALAESKDPMTAAAGGSLGWITTSNFGPDFDKAVSDAAVGSVFTVKTPAGTHVVQVTERSKKRYAVASILRNIAPSSATSETVYKRASGYQGEVLSGTDMDAALVNYPEALTRVSPVITQNTYQLFGLVGARPIIVWAFGEEAGAMNKTILEAERAFVIARVEYAGDKGYKSLEDVKEEIRPEVIRAVKAREMKKKLAAGGSDLASIASSYGPGASTGTAMDLRFSSNTVQNLGDEPKVVGRAFGLKQGEVSKPLAGNNGVYVIKLDGLTEPATPLAPEMLGFRKMTARTSKSSAGVNASFQGLIDAADIDDYRAQFEF